MSKKDFLEQKYCEINQLKNLLQTYPKEYCETIIKVMEKVFNEISEYINNETEKVKNIIKIDNLEDKKDNLYEKIGNLENKIIKSENKSNNDKKSNKCKKHKQNKYIKKKKDNNRNDKLKIFTVDQISKFDGKDGTLAYIIIDGKVYDVTSIKQWFNGKHYGLMAGRDLTEYFNSCHKGEKNILKKLKLVGKIKNSK